MPGKLMGQMEEGCQFLHGIEGSLPLATVVNHQPVALYLEHDPGSDYGSLGKQQVTHFRTEGVDCPVGIRGKDNKAVVKGALPGQHRSKPSAAVDCAGNPCCQPVFHLGYHKVRDCERTVLFGQADGVESTARGTGYLHLVKEIESTGRIGAQGGPDHRVSGHPDTAEGADLCPQVMASIDPGGKSETMPVAECLQEDRPLLLMVC